MLRLQYFGTSALGVAFSSLVLLGILVVLGGGDSPAASAASQICYLALVLGVCAVILSAFGRSNEAAINKSDIDDPSLELAAVRYTIIVPVFNRPDLLTVLLTKIRELYSAWEHIGPGELIIVDDGSTDATRGVALRLIQTLPFPARVVTQPNKGVSGARNRGFWEARGRVGVVIDSDCIPSAEWLPAMVEAVEAGDGVIAFANVVSSRKALFPLESSPAGAVCAGASFAVRTSDYLRLGGNYELYSGASRDDTDLYLCATRFGFEARVVEQAQVWHPLRRNTFEALWGAGIAHRFDNLLVCRHGDRARPFLGDWFLGGQLAGHYPMSLFVYSIVLTLLYGVATTSIQWLPSILAQLLVAACVLFACWLGMVAVFAKIASVPRAHIVRYIVSAWIYAMGCIAGRFIGIFRFKYPLV